MRDNLSRLGLIYRVVHTGAECVADPNDGKPMRYLRFSDADTNQSLPFQIYSIGSYGKDDGGTSDHDFDPLAFGEDGSLYEGDVLWRYVPTKSEDDADDGTK